MSKKTFYPTDEQQHVLNMALDGRDVLVDACIGSGKTTTIEELCRLYDPTARVLYLTYNASLKDEARNRVSKARRKGKLDVHSYHSYARQMLDGLIDVRRTDVGKYIEEFIRLKDEIFIPYYDLIIIDEYQDIDTEISELIAETLRQNPTAQVVAVGDMDQKIQDKTKLDVSQFMLQTMKNPEKVSFSKCFRIDPEFSQQFSLLWNKKINGQNKNHKVRFMSVEHAIDYLAEKDPKDILISGSGYGMRSRIVNGLVNRNPLVFNKNTIYNKAADQSHDGGGRRGGDILLGLPFDSTKGLEKRYSVVCDFDENYLGTRLNKVGVNPGILRNVFLVGASRGKNETIFIIPSRSNYEPTYASDVLGFIGHGSLRKLKQGMVKVGPFNPVDMFEFKYREDIVDLYKDLNVSLVQDKEEVIATKMMDGQLELGAATGKLLGHLFFERTPKDVVKEIKIEAEFKAKTKSSDTTEVGYITDDMEYAIDALSFQYDKERETRRGLRNVYREVSLHPTDFELVPNNGRFYETTFQHHTYDPQWMMLCLNAFKTGDKRYIWEIYEPYVTDEAIAQMMARLSTVLRKDSDYEVGVGVVAYYAGAPVPNIEVLGMVDVIQDGIIYELKFTEALSYEDYLQAAMYLALTGLPEARLWNVKTNEMYVITLNTDPNEFIRKAISVATKGEYDKYDFKGFERI